MILHCNFEELGALKMGANSFLGGTGGEASPVAAPVAAPPEGREEVFALLPRLSGDLTMETLAEQRRVLKAVSAIVDRLKEEMDAYILDSHPAGESAVSSYFLYAHALSVLNRIVELGQEMEALIEVVTGAPPTRDVAATFRFPD
jgi:hypothetical protein